MLRQRLLLAESGRSQIPRATKSLPIQLTEVFADMPFEFEVRHPLWLLRAVLGAALAVLGIIVLRSYSEALGAACLITGLTIGIRGSIGPVLTILFGLLLVALYVGYYYWAVPEKYDYGFDEWASRNWWMFVYFGVLVFGVIASVYQRNTDAWRVLRANYSSGPERIGARGTYPVQSGLLRFDDEFVSVYVIPVEDGLFIAKENEGHIFFPWDRIQEIRMSDSWRDTAIIKIERNNMTPLEFSLPWHSRLSEQVPPNVALVGN